MSSFEEIRYTPGKVAHIVLDRPQYLNAQSFKLREELDQALHAAAADETIGAIVLSGAGGNFSAGHDIGTPEDREHRRTIGRTGTDPRSIYRDMRAICVENTLRWRNLPKPTLAMVDGYCIFGAWMIASSMDLIFAAEDALFLPGQTQYFSAAWDLSPRKAKEILFEHRFMTARECLAHGFVNRVYPKDVLQAETFAFATRVAENYLANPLLVETTKASINHMQDTQGFTAEIDAGYEYFCRMQGLAARRPSAPASGGYARTHVAKANLEASRPWLERQGNA